MNEVMDQELVEELIRSAGFLKTGIIEKLDSFFAMAASPVMAEAQQLIRRVARSRAIVLLVGEWGTGKTLAARIVHELSDRSQAPFLEINSAPLTEEEQAAELFGWDETALWPGAPFAIGRLEQADRGTLFIDQVEELSLAVQAKLVRFLQDREFEPLGCTTPRTADVRIVAGTDRDLESAVRAGAFREDLYYMVGVFPVRLPRLRQRRGDIEPLIRFFSAAVCREFGRSLMFTSEAIRILVSYDWPGNVRELENLIQRLAVVFPCHTIEVEDLMSYLADASLFARTKKLETIDALKELERANVIAALERNDWIQSRAAKELGITLRQMGYRVKKFGLEPLVGQRKAVR